MKPSQYMTQLAQTAAAMNTDPILDLVDEIRTIQKLGKRVFICGNGGSAATADHFALDLQKNIPGGLNVFSLCNSATITAYANDHDYSTIFKHQLSHLSQPHDLLIAISTSGNSENVINAARYALDSLMRVASLTAFGGGRLMVMTHVKIWAPTENIGIAEDLHSASLHAVIDYLRGN